MFSFHIVLNIVHFVAISNVSKVIRKTEFLKHSKIKDLRVQKKPYLVIVGIYLLSGLISLWFDLYRKIGYEQSSEHAAFGLLSDGYFIRSIVTIVVVYPIGISGVFPLIFVVIFGLELLECHESICMRLVEKLRFTPDNKTDGGTELAIEEKWAKRNGNHFGRNSFEEAFTLLKSSFRIYGNVGGAFSLIVVTWNSIILIHFFYLISTTKGDVMLLLDSSLYGVNSCFSLFLLAHFGNVLADEINTNREILWDAIGTQRKLPKNQNQDRMESRALAKWVYNWEWGLTAANAFRVNHGILPAVAGTVLTYFVVSFQLKVGTEYR
ncbi:unnamed protein product [Allacma fusca]|uniref:Uncharacterized protein n=1 Tax=Allacma fusca TaxID=39272 RepID=A0A8J2LJD6_9HEXA|nr:unnamed protein product [Allacma fusca]